MKKQGDLYLKIISIVLAAVVLAYVLFSVLFSSGSSYALTAAVRCEVGDGQTVSGFVVRSEKLLTAPAVYQTGNALLKDAINTASAAQQTQLGYASPTSGISTTAACCMSSSAARTAAAANTWALA